ncbi:trace amine-associated receptor 8a-like [Archocentrus centrarchus]|uniref:trace amine-associated receptor 8a-like n=1 Tax=Archocentrus centrarchus TaxID=63155 RepID=UPI0011E9D9FB|nr:trace amine-associated receptor 8a-like [Archocentrus centrarchus]
MKIFEEVDLCFPQILNSSCRKSIRPHSLSVLIYITLSAVALLTVILNLLLIISISHFKKLHTPTNLLLLSLAVADCFVGLLMFFPIMIIDGCWFLGDLICSMYFLLSYIITSASVGTMVLISIDRYVAICYPLHYSTKVTPKRAKACVYLCWICSSLFQCLVLKDNLVQPGSHNSCYGECVVVVVHAFGVADLLLSFVGPVIVIVVLYLRVFVVAVSQARALRSHIAVVTHEGSLSTNVKKSEMKALRTISVLIIVFLICLCPYYCVTLSGQDAVFSVSSVTLVVCLFYLNSCINPLIYALFYPWFRKSVKQIVTLEILKSGSCEANIM